MAKSKTRKDHKKRIAKRKAKMVEERKQILAKQKEMLMNLIEREKQKGLFDNLQNIPSIPSVGSDGLVDGPSFGPTI